MPFKRSPNTRKNAPYCFSAEKLENTAHICYIIVERKDDNMYRTLGSTDLEMYTLIGGLGWIFVLIYNLFMFRYKQKMLSNCSLTLLKSACERNKSSIIAKEKFWITLEIIVISFIQIYPNGFLNVKFGHLMNTGANYFGLLYFVPLILFAFFYIISIDPFKQTDLITPAYPLALFFVKLGCFCNGCCGGFECEWGLMNYQNEADPKREFPIQLIEAGLALAIFLFLLWYRKRAKEGTMFPIYTIIYSATRFFSEFASNKPDVFGILKTYHILCIIGVILGVTELILVLRYAEKVRPVFDRPVFAWYKPKKSNKKNKNVTHRKKKK